VTALDTIESWADSIRRQERERVLAHIEAEIQGWQARSMMPLYDVSVDHVISSLTILKERIRNGSSLPNLDS
jgi:hypothetical protein